MPRGRSTQHIGTGFAPNLPSHCLPLLCLAHRPPASLCTPPPLPSKVITKEIWHRLIKLHKRFKQPKEYYVIEALENTCTQIRNDFGLLMRNNKPTQEFSSNKKISRMTGNWINSYIETHCGNIFSEYEEEIVEDFHEWIAMGEREAQGLMCLDKYARCQVDELNKDEL